MKSIKTFLLVSCSLLCFISDAQNLNHLFYKAVTTIKSPKGDKVELLKEYDVLINDTLLRTNNKTYIGGDKLSQENKTLYDLSRNIRVAIIRDKAYNIETIDSIYYNSNKLDATGETKTINGLKCEKYEFLKPIVIRSSGSGYVGVTEWPAEWYTLWITKDIQIDKRINRIILKGLLTYTTTEFEGALVQVDMNHPWGKKSLNTVYKLETKETIPVDEAKFVMPWKLGYEGLVPEISYSTHNGIVPTNYKASEKDLDILKRHRKLLQDITGVTKAKDHLVNLQE